MLVLFPFEEPFYRCRGIPVTWVGHPLVDAVGTAPDLSKEEAQRRLGLNPWRVTVGLLPGSREHEVRRLVPVLSRAAARIARHMPGVQFLIVQAPGVPSEWLAPMLRHPQFEAVVTRHPLLDCLPAMEAAVITSGTATLEAALHAVPMVVVYRTSWPTYLAAKLVVRVPHIAMVNLIAGRALVPEFVQHRAQPARIAEALVALLRDQPQMDAMKTGLRAVKTALGPPGAVERAALAVLAELEQKHETLSTRPGRRPSLTTTPTGSCSRPATP
jgi:lipid-A-disaccharide synthase